MRCVQSCVVAWALAAAPGILGAQGAADMHGTSGPSPVVTCSREGAVSLSVVLTDCGPSGEASGAPRSSLERSQVAHQIMLLCRRETETPNGIVVVHDIHQRRRAAVMEVRGVLPESAQRRRA